MTRDEQIKQALKGFNQKKETVLIGDVLSVDESAATCVVSVNGLEIEDVRLRAVEDNDKGMFCVPKIGSTVIILRLLKSDDFCMVQASELSKVKVKIGSRTLVIDENNAIFDSGNNDGLVKVADLVTKLNNLENKVNTIITMYNSHVHAANGTPTVSLVVGTLTPTVKDNLENTNVKH